MSDLAPILQSFFLDKMITQKHASQHTIRSYRDTFRLFPGFAQQTTGTPPWELDISQLDAGLITSFLRWLQAGRGNSPRTRNARLAAIRSLFRYAALRAPDNAAVIQRVLAIEASRTDHHRHQLADQRRKRRAPRRPRPRHLDRPPGLRPAAGRAANRTARVRTDPAHPPRPSHGHRGPRALRPVNRTVGRCRSSGGPAVPAPDRRAARKIPIARPWQPCRRPDRRRNRTYGAQPPAQLLLAADL